MKALAYSQVYVKSSKKHYAIALIASVVMMSLVLGIIYISTSLPVNNDEQVIVRKISTALPPPPPAPPKVTKKKDNTQIAIQVQGRGGQIKLADAAPITVATFDFNDEAASFAQPLNIVVPNIEFQGFSLNELDAVPRLLSSAKITIPESLKRQAQSTVLIKLEVSIDEQGRVKLLNVVTNTYPGLNFEITEMVSRARFTSPKRQGEIVKARFIWPLEVKL